MAESYTHGDQALDGTQSQSRQAPCAQARQKASSPARRSRRAVGPVEGDAGAVCRETEGVSGGLDGLAGEFHAAEQVGVGGLEGVHPAVEAAAHLGLSFGWSGGALLVERRGRSVPSGGHIAAQLGEAEAIVPRAPARPDGDGARGRWPLLGVELVHIHGFFVHGLHYRASGHGGRGLAHVFHHGFHPHGVPDYPRGSRGEEWSARSRARRFIFWQWRSRPRRTWRGIWRGF